MAIEWLSSEKFAEKVDKVHALLVVVPDEDADKIAEKMEKLLKELNDEMPNEGFLFALKLSGVKDDINIPVFFIKETLYFCGEAPTGLIRVIPMGGASDQVVAGKMGIKGANSFNKLLIKNLAWRVWMVKTGRTESLDKSEPEIHKFKD